MSPDGGALSRCSCRCRPDGARPSSRLLPGARAAGGCALACGHTPRLACWRVKAACALCHRGSRGRPGPSGRCPTWLCQVAGWPPVRLCRGVVPGLDRVPGPSNCRAQGKPQPSSTPSSPGCRRTGSASASCRQWLCQRLGLQLTPLLGPRLCPSPGQPHRRRPRPLSRRPRPPSLRLALAGATMAPAMGHTMVRRAGRVVVPHRQSLLLRPHPRQRQARPSPWLASLGCRCCGACAVAAGVRVAVAAAAILASSLAPRAGCSALPGLV